MSAAVTSGWESLIQTNQPWINDIRSEQATRSILSLNINNHFDNTNQNNAHLFSTVVVLALHGPSFRKHTDISADKSLDTNKVQ